MCQTRNDLVEASETLTTNSPKSTASHIAVSPPLSPKMTSSRLPTTQTTSPRRTAVTRFWGEPNWVWTKTRQDLCKLITVTRPLDLWAVTALATVFRLWGNVGRRFTGVYKFSWRDWRRLWTAFGNRTKNCATRYEVLIAFELFVHLNLNGKT